MKKYINHFFSLKAAADLIHFFQLSHSSSAKEVTESMAVFRAAMDFFKYRTDKPRTVIVVGDGATPRTAALFAYMTKWDCYSIDPEFNLDKCQTIFDRCKPERLYYTRKKIENVMIDCEGKPAILVLPHSHADMAKSIKACKNYDYLDVIAMPCCFTVPERYTTQEAVKNNNLRIFTDPDVWSPKRTLYLWERIA